MANHTFCRMLLMDVMPEVRKKYTPEQIKAVWVWCDSGGSWEFHGPNKEFHYGLRGADCAWSARAAGWSKLLEPKEDM